jgi:hypothetical protein
MLNRRQGDVHDGGIENDHELRDADQDEHEPAVCFRPQHDLLKTMVRTKRTQDSGYDT